MTVRPSVSVITGLLDREKIPAAAKVMNAYALSYRSTPRLVNESNLTRLEKQDPAKWAKARDSRLRKYALEPQITGYFTPPEIQEEILRLTGDIEGIGEVSKSSREILDDLLKKKSSQLNKSEKTLLDKYNQIQQIRNTIRQGTSTISKNVLGYLEGGDLDLTKYSQGLIRSGTDRGADINAIINEETISMDIKALMGKDPNISIGTGTPQFRQKSAAEEFLNTIQKTNTQGILDIIKKDPYKPIYRDFENKSKYLLVTFPFIPGQTNIPTAIIRFEKNESGSHLNSQNFYIDKPKKISTIPGAGFGVNLGLNVRTQISNRIAKDIQENVTKLQVFNANQNLKDLTDKFNQIEAGKGKSISYKPRDSGIEATLQINMLGVDVPRSIPLGKIAAVPRRKSSAFTSRTAAARQTLAQTRAKTPTIGSFISNDTITALTKREMMRRMPIGPVGGRPLSTRVLTYRTGRFVQSLRVVADIRNQAIQYYYSPIYWVHEATTRNPHNLIGASIASVTRSLFNRRFSISKSETEL